MDKTNKIIPYLVKLKLIDSDMVKERIKVFEQTREQYKKISAIDFITDTFSSVYDVAPIHRIVSILKVKTSHPDDNPVSDRVLLAMLYDMLDELEDPTIDVVSKSSNTILVFFSDIMIGNTKEETMKMFILFTYHMIVWLEERIDRNDRWKLPQ